MLAYGNGTTVHLCPHASDRRSFDQNQASAPSDAAEVLHVPPHSYLPADKAAAKLASGIALDYDLPSGHAPPASPVSRADMVPAASAYMQQASFHLPAGPGAGIALHQYASSRHLRSQVHSGVSLYGDNPLRHSGADIFDAAEVALQGDLR